MQAAARSSAGLTGTQSSLGRVFLARRRTQARPTGLVEPSQICQPAQRPGRVFTVLPLARVGLEPRRRQSIELPAMVPSVKD